MQTAKLNTTGMRVQSKASFTARCLAPRTLLPGHVRRQPTAIVRAAADKKEKIERGLATRAAVASEIDVASTGTHAPSSTSPTSQLAGLSYNQQYDLLFKQPLNTRQVVPKPDRAAQAKEVGAHKVLLSDVWGVQRRPTMLQGRKMNSKDWTVTLFLGAMHMVALAAPFTFSWDMVKLFFAAYFVTGCLGITTSYHRMLSHKSFQVPKWLEYPLAYCGVLAVQGDPMEWASSHRYHHLHTDTPLDPHSPYEGFFWSHWGWLFDNEITLQRVGNRSNVSDMESQAYYRWLRDTYAWHVVAQFATLYALGGLPAVVWGGALRIVWVYHITWFVNSATHCWGYQTYDTGDLSRNIWWVGILAWGEGWHNNHHAFEFSARHGFEWHQIDVTWYIIWMLERAGLAYNVKLPTEKQKAKLAFKKS